jgi:hypothetical protein
MSWQTYLITLALQVAARKLWRIIYRAKLFSHTCLTEFLTKSNLFKFSDSYTDSTKTILSEGLLALKIFLLFICLEWQESNTKARAGSCWEQ